MIILFLSLFYFRKNIILLLLYPKHVIGHNLGCYKHVDFLCRNYILNGLDNTLYNVYCAFNTARELWESLDKKYKTEDAGLKMFVVGKFLDYKMLDSKTVISQVQDLQVILHDM